MSKYKFNAGVFWSFVDPLFDGGEKFEILSKFRDEGIRFFENFEIDFESRIRVVGARSIGKYEADLKTYAMREFGLLKKIFDMTPSVVHYLVTGFEVASCGLNVFKHSAFFSENEVNGILNDRRGIVTCPDCILDEDRTTASNMVNKLKQHFCWDEDDERMAIESSLMGLLESGYDIFPKGGPVKDVKQVILEGYVHDPDILKYLGDNPNTELWDLFRNENDFDLLFTGELSDSTEEL